MGFEEPEMGDSEVVSDGSVNTVYYFGRLGIVWGTLTDANGKTRSVFHRSRQKD